MARQRKTKTCTGCGRRRPLAAFTKRRTSKDGLNSRCRDCTRAMVKSHYDRNGVYYRKKQSKRKREIKKEFDRLIAEAKNVPCEDCGKQFASCAMDLDHVRGEKSFEVSSAISHTTNVDVLLAEIAKCEVLCAVCHRIHTHYRRIHDPVAQ